MKKAKPSEIETPLIKRSNFTQFFIKGGLLLSLFCNVTACNGDSSADGVEVQEALSQPILEEVDTVTYCSTEDGLDGIWALSNYFDPIIANKSIVNCQSQIPAWFGILLEIKNDAVLTYGSLIDMNKNSVNCESDTLTVFETNWGDWCLLNYPDELHLRLITSENQADSTIYIYKKRSEMSDFITEVDRPFKIESKITAYFNEELLAGTYLNENSDTVYFQKIGQLIGLDNYNEYEIDSSFGTSHPFQNLDGVLLRNRANKTFDFYHWEFSQEQLILTTFVSDTVLFNEEWVETDNYVLGDKQYKLRRAN